MGSQQREVGLGMVEFIRIHHHDPGTTPVMVGMAVTGRLLERTMRIPRLGRMGAEHLATDLNYIMNVFTALGVPSHPHPLLKYITQLVMMDDQIIRSKIQLNRKETSEAFEVIKRAELRIAYVRGISA